MTSNASATLEIKNYIITAKKNGKRPTIGMVFVYYFYRYRLFLDLYCCLMLLVSHFKSQWMVISLSLSLSLTFHCMSLLYLYFSISNLSIPLVPLVRFTLFLNQLFITHATLSSQTNRWFSSVYLLSSSLLLSLQKDGREKIIHALS